MPAWDWALEVLVPYNIGTIIALDCWITHIKLFPYNEEEEKLVQAFSRERFGVCWAGLFGFGEFNMISFPYHYL